MAGLWTLHVWLYLPVTLSCFISCCLFIRFLGIGKSFTFYFIFTIVYIFERVHIHVGLWFSGEGWGMEEGGWDNYFSSFFLPMSLEREVREGVPVPCCQATSSRGDMTILCHLRDPSVGKNILKVLFERSWYLKHCQHCCIRVAKIFLGSTGWPGLLQRIHIT